MIFSNIVSLFLYVVLFVYDTLQGARIRYAFVLYLPYRYYFVLAYSGRKL